MTTLEAVYRDQVRSEALVRSPSEVTLAPNGAPRARRTCCVKVLSLAGDRLHVDRAEEFPLGCVVWVRGLSTTPLRAVVKECRESDVLGIHYRLALELTL